jgi:hypothetical protein
MRTCVYILFLYANIVGVMGKPWGIFADALSWVGVILFSILLAIELVRTEERANVQS